LNLPFLLKTTVQDTKPPIGTRSWNDKTPLKVVARSQERKGHCVDYKGAFNTLEELTDCMHAFLLPGT
jgi:hypothetical protein